MHYPPPRPTAPARAAAAAMRRNRAACAPAREPRPERDPGRCSATSVGVPADSDACRMHVPAQAPGSVVDAIDQVPSCAAPAERADPQARPRERPLQPRMQRRCGRRRAKTEALADDGSAHRLPGASAIAIRERLSTSAAAAEVPQLPIGDCAKRVNAPVRDLRLIASPVPRQPLDAPLQLHARW
jgi:hypothetical protein